MNNHTTFKLKKRLLVILNNGKRFTDRLVEQKSRYYIFEEKGKVSVSEIRTATYYKGAPTDE